MHVGNGLKGICKVTMRSFQGSKAMGNCMYGKIISSGRVTFASLDHFKSLPSRRLILQLLASSAKIEPRYLTNLVFVGSN